MRGKGISMGTLSHSLSIRLIPVTEFGVQDTILTRSNIRMTRRIQRDAHHIALEQRRAPSESDRNRNLGAAYRDP